MHATTNQMSDRFRNQKSNNIRVAYMDGMCQNTFPIAG